MDEGREPKDRIEHIVRQAEEGAHFEFNPAAWSAMEQKLDDLEPMPFSVWKIIFPLTGVAVILMLLLWPISAQDRHMAEAENAVSTEVTTEQASEAAKPANADEVPTEPEETGANTNQEEQVVEEARTITAADNVSQPAETTAQDQTTEESKSAAQEPVTERKSSTNARLVSPSRTVTLADNEETTPAGGNEEGSAASGIELLSIYLDPSPMIFPEPDLVFEVDSSNFQEGEPEEYFERSKWAFSAMVSLDMSATGLDGFTDPGTMFGLGVEYYFANSWSIQTGAAISVKKYRALGTEYETPGWIAARPDDFIEALANCLVIDLPLNLRKYFTTKKGRTFFVSTGVSSYLMLRETYEYEYTEDRPNWLPEWTIRNRNQHYFGILNLSFGFEKPLGKNLSLGIEPFAKLPLTGIGAGGVRFLSFGTNLAIRFRK